jgi:hypothetical protein
VTTSSPTRDRLPSRTRYRPSRCWRSSMRAVVQKAPIRCASEEIGLRIITTTPIASSTTSSRTVSDRPRASPRALMALSRSARRACSAVATSTRDQIPRRQGARDHCEGRCRRPRGPCEMPSSNELIELYSRLHLQSATRFAAPDPDATAHGADRLCGQQAAAGIVAAPRIDRLVSFRCLPALELASLPTAGEGVKRVEAVPSVERVTRRGIGARTSLDPCP